MNEAPHSIKVTYEQVGSLIAAVSGDLKGFHVLGNSLDHVHREAPIAAKALVWELFGVDCTYEWASEHRSRLDKEPAFAELVCQ